MALDFKWDTAGRLRSVHQGASSPFNATYAADGERISVSEGGQSRTSSFRLFDDAGAGESTTHTPGLAQRKNGVDRLYSTDHLGSTRYLTSPDPIDPGYKFGARYDAYGQRTAGDGSDGPNATRRQYAGAHGYERTGDTVGLDYLYQRYYDPAVGRFITRDPIGWAGGLNLFGYTGNDPVNAVDPTGLDAGWAQSPYPNDPYGFEAQRWRSSGAYRVLRSLRIYYFKRGDPLPPTAPKMNAVEFIKDIGESLSPLYGIGILGIPSGRG